MAKINKEERIANCLLDIHIFSFTMGEEPDVTDELRQDYHDKIEKRIWALIYLTGTEEEFAELTGVPAENLRKRGEEALETMEHWVS